MKATFAILFLLLAPARFVTAGEGIDTNAVTATVRAFLSAAMTMNVAEVKRHALPHPDLGVLGEGPQPPPPVKERMRATFSQASCRFLKVGEVIELPGGGSLTVDANQVASSRCLVRPLVGGSPMPLPLAVIRTDSGWRVDASPIIAARKAATGRRNAPPR